MVATATPKITTHFQSITRIGWYASAYLLTAASFQMLARKLYTFYSVKWTYIASLIVYGVGCSVCGSASSSTILVISRAIMGIG